MLTWDLETDMFGPCYLAPEPICISVCDDEDNVFVVAHCEPHFDDVVEECLKKEMANQNIAFDMSVLLAHRPQFRDLIFDAYREDAVTDIAIREKLITLATTGDLEFLHMPSGAKIKLGWSQADMEKRLLGVDRTAEKNDDDAWRKNYIVLKGRPASEYPPEAYQYAAQDALYAKKIYKHQEARVKEMSFDVLRPQHLNTRAQLALNLSSCWGFPIDKPRVDKLLVELHKQWDTDAVKVVDGKTVPAYSNLLESGILKPAVPAKPYGGQMRKAEEALGCIPMNWEDHREKLEALGIKFTKPQKASYSDTKKLELVVKVCEENEIPVPRTEKEGVRFDKEVQAELAGLNDTLDEYIERKTIEKLVTTELPGLTSSRCHPRYDILKKTGRTSSFGNSAKDLNPAYPSRNIQQIDPRARQVYIASEGHLLCATDYSAIELASAAQKCLSLFQYSVLAETINSGKDPHARLAANIVALMDPEWQASDDPEENYSRFKALEGTERDAYYSHYRTLAKPTGLGFWGGLGISTFIGYCKATYGVDLVKISGSLAAARDLAKSLKDVWLSTYPEAAAYFRWVTKNCVDLEFSAPGDDRYAYVSPFGMVRRNCFYTEATNGAALQTPTAEGAKIALWKLTEAMYDARLGSCLYGSHLLAFIHDECITEIPDDDLRHARAMEGSRLMVEGMKQVITDVNVTAEPVLMYRWNKKAKQVFVDGKLIPWLPKSEAA